MCNTQYSLLLNQHNVDGAPQNYDTERTLENNSETSDTASYNDAARRLKTID